MECRHENTVLLIYGLVPWVKPWFGRTALAKLSNNRFCILWIELYRAYLVIDKADTIVDT
jgi:hypothetical protein